MIKINIELIQEQWDELCEIILSTLNEPIPYITKSTNNWWKEQLGFIPSRVDRINGKTFRITK